MFQPDLETMPPGERRLLQDRRLVDLVARLSAVGTPYWRQKTAGIGEVRGVEDLRRLPFTTKSELRDTYPYGMLAVPIEGCARLHASSGTSGKPTIVAYTARDLRTFAEVCARSLACAGARPDDVIQVAYGYGLFTGGLGLHGGVEALGATAIPASGGNTALQVQLLADLGARGLCCTPSFAVQLAERAAAEGVLADLAVAYLVLGAEPWSNELREKIQAMWGGAVAVDIYGLSEVMGPGVMCESVEGRGAPFVFDDHFLPEVLVPGTDEPAERGERGELVLTTLTKEAMPVLRYRTGDITRFVDEPSACGRTHPRLDRISGRVDDMLIVRGVNVFPSAIEAVLMDEHVLAGHWVVVVDRRGTMADLTVHCELADPEHLPRVDAVRDQLERALASALRIRIAVDLGGPGAVPRPEGGKARRVVEWQAGEPHPLHG
jgi:phenylacetate-CoA ligase